MQKNRQEKLEKNKDTYSCQHIITITYYTDPLCCWSWAMEPAWRQVQDEFGDSLHIRYKMGGLLPSWHNFTDRVNDITRPAQMGPEWMYAAKITGAEVNSSIWLKDPPASSFPACIAVKCVELQDSRLSVLYLRQLREAVMLRGLNIARTSVLYQLAADLPLLHESFNLLTFRKDLLGEGGRIAFRQDWQEVQYKGINRLPTMVFGNSRHEMKVLRGYQTFDVLRNMVSGLQE